DRRATSGLRGPDHAAIRPVRGVALPYDAGEEAHRQGFGRFAPTSPGPCGTAGAAGADPPRRYRRAARGPSPSGTDPLAALARGPHDGGPGRRPDLHQRGAAPAASRGYAGGDQTGAGCAGSGPPQLAASFGWGTRRLAAARCLQGPAARWSDLSPLGYRLPPG